MKKQSDKNFNPLNPYCSSTLQAILDIETMAERLGLPRPQTIAEAKELLADPQFRHEADALYNAHRYPDKKLVFAQTALYDECPGRFELPPIEQVILDLMERLQSPAGYVTVVKNDFVDALHLSVKDRKNLQRYIDDLVEKGFLTCIYRPPRGSHRPGEYRVNRGVTRVGKPEPEEKIAPITGCPEPQYTRISKELVLPDGRRVSSGMLEKKKSVSDAPTDDALPLSKTTKEKFHIPNNISNPIENQVPDFLSEIETAEAPDEIPEFTDEDLA